MNVGNEKEGGELKKNLPSRKIQKLNTQRLDTLKRSEEEQERFEVAIRKMKLVKRGWNSLADLLPSIQKMQLSRQVRISLVSIVPWCRSLSVKKASLVSALQDLLVPALGELVQQLRTLPSSIDKKVCVCLRRLSKKPPISVADMVFLTGPDGSQPIVAPFVE